MKAACPFASDLDPGSRWPRRPHCRRRSPRSVP